MTTLKNILNTIKGMPYTPDVYLVSDNQVDMINIMSIIAQDIIKLDCYVNIFYESDEFEKFIKSGHHQIINEKLYVIHVTKNKTINSNIKVFCNKHNIKQDTLII